METQPVRVGSAAEKPCNLCGASDRRLLFKKFGFDIVACRQCGLQYLPWALTAEDLAAFYNDGYFTGQADRHGYLDYAGDEALLLDNFRDKLTGVAALEPTGRLLDVGAALGYFVQAAHEAGWEASGLEVSEYAAGEARKRGLDVRTGASVSVFPRSHFNVVTLWDVIEHLNDPLQVLQEIREVLAPGGLLVVSTGDLGHPFSRVLGRHARMYAPPQHLYYFSRDTLSRMLEAAGFEVVSIGPDKKRVTLQYVLHVVRGLADNAILSRLAAWLEGLHLNLSLQLTLWDVMIVSARKKEPAP